MVLITVLVIVSMMMTVAAAAARAAYEAKRFALLRADRAAAFNAAEAALEHAEAAIDAGMFSLLPPCRPPLVNRWPAWRTVDWDHNPAIARLSLRADVGQTRGGRQPSARYFVERLPGDNGLYRVTARGGGVMPDTVLFLQSVYQSQAGLLERSASRLGAVGEHDVDSDPCMVDTDSRLSRRLSWREIVAWHTLAHEARQHR